MGLDLVEISMGVEETFNVRLSSDDLEGLVRDGDIAVGDLYVLLLRRLHLQDITRYDVELNRHLWEDMRSTFHTATTAPLDEVRLSTPLASLFPSATRRANWTAMRQACPYQVKELEYPRAVRPIGVLLAVCFALLELLQIWQQPLLNWLWPFFGIFSIWMVCETYWKILSIFAPIRKRFPGGMKTVKDLCRAVMADNYEHICDGNRAAGIALDDRAQAVWLRLISILADTLGVDPSEVTFRSRIVRDLGAN